MLQNILFSTQYISLLTQLSQNRQNLRMSLIGVEKAMNSLRFNAFVQNEMGINNRYNVLKILHRKLIK